MSDQPTSCEHGMPLHIGCDDCTISRMHSRIEADEALMRTAAEALERCYDVTEWPCNGSTVQDAAITALRKRLESSK